MGRRSIVAAYLSIALLAGAVRFVGLDRCPAGLFRDEAEKGYSAWALATDGGVIEFPRDRQPPIRFKRWPYVIEVGGVTTSAVYQYASMPFVAAMGLGVGSTRMAAATAGTAAVGLLGVVLMGAWGGRGGKRKEGEDGGYPEEKPEKEKELQGQGQGRDQEQDQERGRFLALAAIAATLALAVSPWHFVFSRWAQQGIFVPLGMIGVLAGLAGAEREKRWGFPLAGFSLGFAFYAYSGAQPFALLWGAALLAIYRREARAQWREAAAGAAIFLAWAAPMLWITFFRGGDARLDAVALWTADDATPARTAWRFVANYLAHFNPEFLFIKGDALARHAIPRMGQLVIVEIVLLPIGLVATFRRRMPLRGALLAAFLCGPVGAAITRIGIPHALRALPMALPCAVWSGVGLSTIVERIYRGDSQDGAARAWTALLRFFSRSISGPFHGLLLTILVAYWICVGVALWAYWVEQTGPEGRDPIGGFAASHRESFEAAFGGRAPGAKVWINAYIDPYTAYHAMFHGRLRAKDLAERGFEANGVWLFDPRQISPDELHERIMAPGDWMIDAGRAGEAVVEQKAAEGQKNHKVAN